jgi:hypothetical protein
MREVQCLKDKRPCDLSPVRGTCRHNFAWGGKCFDRKLSTKKQIAIDVEAYEAEVRAKIHQEIAEEEAKAQAASEALDEQAAQADADAQAEFEAAQGPEGANPDE